MTATVGVDPGAARGDYAVWVLHTPDGQIRIRDDRGWNPRYLAYCIAHRAISPEEMMSRDDIAWPGGLMTGFMCWINEQWAAWERSVDFPRDGVKCDAVHREFDCWLADRVIRA
jgi:hypothetical protein